MVNFVTHRRKKRPVGRPRIHADGAARQRAYRERKQNRSRKSKAGKRK